MLKDLVLKNRSYRRFHQDVAIEHETLRELIDMARLSASAANRQALKYILSGDPKRNALIYPNIRMDGNPPEGERPSAYIIILEDTKIRLVLACDYGIAAQTIHFGAVEKGFGGCMIGNIDRARINELLMLTQPAHLQKISNKVLTANQRDRKRADLIREKLLRKNR